jgi:hypothetical protein
MRAALGVILTALLFLVGGRFIALLVAADRTDLVAWILRHSDFWVRPFSHMFGLQNASAPGGGTFEFASLVAFGAYFIAGGIAIAIASRLLLHGDSYQDHPAQVIR